MPSLQISAFLIIVLMADSSLLVGIQFEYPYDFEPPIDDFYHSNHDLLLEGLRLRMCNFQLLNFYQIRWSYQWFLSEGEKTPLPD